MYFQRSYSCFQLWPLKKIIREFEFWRSLDFYLFSRFKGTRKQAEKSSFFDCSLLR